MFSSAKYWEQHNPRVSVSEVKADLDKYAHQGGEYDVNHYGATGWTPLMETIFINDYYPLVDLLLDYGADVNARDKRDGRTALMIAALYSKKPDIFESLLDEGAKVNTFDDDGWTALMWAATSQKTDEDIINLLVKAGADTELQKDKDGRTALMLAAAFSNNPDVIEALEYNGADVDARDADGLTAWDHLQENKKLKKNKWVRELLEL